MIVTSKLENPSPRTVIILLSSWILPVLFFLFVMVLFVCSFWRWTPEVWIWTGTGEVAWAVFAFHWLQAFGGCAGARGCRCGNSEGRC